ncbi:copper chaperone PCu(A)C [Corynebacterium aquatimens]|uniref:copper chaperone PCu(A)C n=1 Tax=Corynebacterium TaxID=1716 RepID=UPI001F1C5109|nr:MULTISPECIES: copper chaperone PCu(A)C [Corynebacterium]QYH19644.1 copper chaperone PCu(A)C [Corynebacterium aquatimens]UIZ91361.1 copper chaperone PCu(A)C [Corynebacterium sp. CNCTC7651]
MRRTFAALSAGALALTLVACGNGDGNNGTVAPTSGTATGAAAADEKHTHGDADVMFDGATIRAKAAADTPDGTDMTAIFGTLHNHTDKDVTLSGFTTSLGDASYEIHEVVDGVMREKTGGTVIPAGGSYEFKPGADHLMIMGYTPEIAAGDTVDVTLNFADGSEVVVPDVAVRTMLPGDESYGEDGNLQGHQHGAEHEGRKH